MLSIGASFRACAASRSRTAQLGCARWLATTSTGGVTGTDNDKDDNDDETPENTTTDPTSIDSDDAKKEEEEEKDPILTQALPPLPSLPGDLEKNLRPLEVVSELDRHIVGQDDAKRAVAIAMRNRWRRKQLPAELRKEVTPRNVLMIGPTGCGKTEVARRMAALGGAPFIKVEATKFTEVGYHGRDVDQIIRDLMDVAISLTKKQKTEEFKAEVDSLVEERILDLLTGPGSGGDTRARESFLSMLRDGQLDDQEVELDVPIGPGGNQPDKGQNPFQLDPTGNNPDVDKKWSEVLSIFGKRGPTTERKRLPISQAREVITQMELDRLLENVDMKKEALTSVEESGIVFIDEIDKICSSREHSQWRSDASADGVQRDLLPLVEGTTINTKYGNVKTDFILFVASGAFHAVKPSDMLPELQGRLPIRVELQGLTEEDLYKILTEPVANLIRQQVELLATEGVTLNFDDDAVKEIARMAALANKTVENIGARRLHTVMERLMEGLSFDAAEMEDGSVVTVNTELVQERLSDVLVKSDLSRYIL